LRVVPELVYSPWASEEELAATGKKAKAWRIDLVLFVNGLPVATLELKSEFKPYIFIETGFKRTSQPVFILATLQSNRFLVVDEAIWEQPLNDQLEPVQEQIKEHYRQQPVIDMWGEVKQYVYYYGENLVLIFSTTGQLSSTKMDYFYSKATLSI